MFRRNRPAGEAGPRKLRPEDEPWIILDAKEWLEQNPPTEEELEAAKRRPQQIVILGKAATRNLWDRAA